MEKKINPLAFIWRFTIEILLIKMNYFREKQSIMLRTGVKAKSIPKTLAMRRKQPFEYTILQRKWKIIKLTKYPTNFIYYT